MLTSTITIFSHKKHAVLQNRMSNYERSISRNITRVLCFHSIILVSLSTTKYVNHKITRTSEQSVLLFIVTLYNVEVVWLHVGDCINVSWNDGFLHTELLHNIIIVVRIVYKKVEVLTQKQIHAATLYVIVLFIFSPKIERN